MDGLLALASAYWGTIAFVVYGMIISWYGEINRVSRVLRQVEKRRASVDLVSGKSGYARIIKREIASMNDLRIKGGSTFYYDKTLLINVIGIVLVQSVNMLIMK